MRPRRLPRWLPEPAIAKRRDRRTVATTMSIRVTEFERERLRAAALDDGMQTTTWARRVLLAAARGVRQERRRARRPLPDFWPIPVAEVLGLSA